MFPELVREGALDFWAHVARRAGLHGGAARGIFRSKLWSRAVLREVPCRPR